MKALVLLPSVPEPPDAGAKLRNRAMLRWLSAEHTVDAIAFGSGCQATGLGRLVRRGRLVPPPAGRGAARRLLQAARSPLPDMAHRLWSAAFAQALREQLQAERYDVVQAEGIEMAPYLAQAAPDQRVYDAHNPEFLLQRRASAAATGRVAALYSRLQWQRLLRFERQVVQRSRLTLAVSEHDANQLLALAGPSARVAVVPNGIDVRAYPFRPQPPAEPSLLFIGTLGYRPNAEAVRWLIEQVLPRLRARLFVVGAQPPAGLVRAGQHDPRLAVTGPVPDERSYLQRSMALLLPARVAAGSRLKALVAMAAGVPIVSTALGMEGIEAEPGVHWLPAESAEQWVQALERLLAEPALQVRIARAARELVEARYDWSALRPAFEAAYAQLA